VDNCGFKFVVEAATAVDPTSVIAHESAEHPYAQDKDLYVAVLQMPNEYLYTEVIVAVLAKLPPPDGHTGGIWSKKCQESCPRLSPQGLLTNSGPYIKTGPLKHSNILDIWPDFGCRTWITVDVPFFSNAIKRVVTARARLPGAQQENPLARPSQQLPTIMFRLNSEWYWDHPGEEYGHWHNLMVNGEMESVAVVEIYIAGVGWQEWTDQPIYTTQRLHQSCGQCDEELQFICKNWESTGFALYNRGDHNFDHSAAFFEELWKMVMPQLLRRLPNRTDSKPVRAGVWGYCIGGLGAWNAITTHPDLYNVAYIGSPAMDYDCGDAFRAVRNISLQGHGLKPKIYIDSGADEGYEMNRQSLLLFRKLQEQGLVEGHDVFYSRAPFGTHQGRMFLRRALKALLVMFGSGNPTKETYRSVAPSGQEIPHYLLDQPIPWVLITTVAVISFATGLFMMQLVSGTWRQCPKYKLRTFAGARETLLGA
jgi:multisubunit Na+/H+ antiporter MnhC subunit